MTQSDKTRVNLASTLSWFVRLNDAGWITLLTTLWQVLERHVPTRMQTGMYEVLDFEACLDIQDAEGKTAFLYKKEKVKYLEDNIIAYRDQAWGQGDIFADYKCSPGYPVDFYQEGHRYRVLISLRETRKRGDIDTFHIQRRITNGFQDATEYFQIRIEHITGKLTMKVVFPSDRFPKRADLVEQNKNRTTTLNPEHFQTLPDGRQQLTWQTSHPRRFEVYSLRWDW